MRLNMLIHDMHVKMPSSIIVEIAIISSYYKILNFNNLLYFMSRHVIRIILIVIKLL